MAIDVNTASGGETLQLFEVIVNGVVVYNYVGPTLIGNISNNGNGFGDWTLGNIDLSGFTANSTVLFHARVDWRFGRRRIVLHRSGYANERAGTQFPPFIGSGHVCSGNSSISQQKQVSPALKVGCCRNSPVSDKDTGLFHFRSHSFSMYCQRFLLLLCCGTCFPGGFEW